MEQLDQDSSFRPQFEFHEVLISLLSKELPPGTVLDPEEESTIIGIYSTIYHPHDQTDLFFYQLKNCPNEAVAELVLDMIISWEIRRSDHTSKKEAMDCIMKNVSKDIELKNWVLEKVDRGFLHKMKQRLFYVIPDSCFYSFDLISVAISTLFFYWDIVKDVITYILLNHISSKILVSIPNENCLTRCFAFFHFRCIDLKLSKVSTWMLQNIMF